MIENYLDSQKIQQFYLIAKQLHYRTKMSKNKEKDVERDLIGSLLQDLELTQTPRSKKQQLPQRMQAFSAPPAFLDIDYKVDYDFLDSSTFQSPDPEDQNIMQAFSKKQISFSKSFQPQIPLSHSYRKMSCDSGLLQYCNNSNPQSFNFYSYSHIYSPTQQLFSNLERVSQWAKDQNGSRTVQEIFENESDQRKDIIFHVIIKDSMNLIIDRFGNYVFQKIFQKGLQQHKQHLVNKIDGSIYNLSLHAYGCRVIQKQIQFINGKKQLQQKFLEQISQKALSLIENQNGNHVIQKCFQVFTHQKIGKIVQVITQHLNQLAFHPYGCRVVQKYLQNYSQQQKCKKILAYLLQQCIPLSQCQFGNYVMQHIVTKCRQQRKKVFSAFLQHVYELSTNKYASNVMQKAIQSQGSNFCEYLADWFILNQKQFILLSKHQFGNYVVQSMLNKVSKEKKLILRATLKENTSQISKSQHGRHVLMQMQSLKIK